MSSRTAFEEEQYHPVLFPHDQVRNLLQAGFADPSADIRAASAFGAYYHPEWWESFRSQLEHALSDSVSLVRRWAMEAIVASLDDVAEQRAFYTIIQDPDVVLRRDAIKRALERYELDPEALPIYVRAFRDPEERIRNETMEFLEDLMTNRSTRPYIESEMREELVIAAAANATPKQGVKSYDLGLNLLESLDAVKEYVSLFITALDYPDPDIQLTARRSLEDVGIYPSQLKR